MKPLSVEMTCLLGIQNKIQAVCYAKMLALIQPVGGGRLCFTYFYLPPSPPTDFQTFLAAPKHFSLIFAKIQMMEN